MNTYIVESRMILKEVREYSIEILANSPEEATEIYFEGVEKESDCCDNVDYFLESDEVISVEKKEVKKC
ncbi:MAG TPA: hypothetical protein DF712_06610 [Balneola sp.]|nr:hypothetical protein [Balneola sp.]|tara:strand:+ start:148 stop:354 length:207 start_codon:yes stop_codon:yes gene_type:complete